MLRTAPNFSNITNRVPAHISRHPTFDVVAGFVGKDKQSSPLILHSEVWEGYQERNIRPLISVCSRASSYSDSQWTEENNKSNVAFDSWAALSSIKTGKSCRQDRLIKSYQLIHEFHSKDLMGDFVWVSAHVRVEGNEAVDVLAKESLKSQMLDIRIPFSSQTEDKSMGEWWQEHWNINNTDKNHLHIQKHEGLDWKEDGVISCLRIGHIGLNQLLNEIGKHPTGRCVHCKQSESGKHVLFECRGNEGERRVLASLIKGTKVSFKSQTHTNMWYNFEGNRTNWKDLFFSIYIYFLSILFFCKSTAPHSNLVGGSIVPKLVYQTAIQSKQRRRKRRRRRRTTTTTTTTRPYKWDSILSIPLINR